MLHGRPQQAAARPVARGLVLEHHLTEPRKGIADMRRVVDRQTTSATQIDGRKRAVGKLRTLLRAEPRHPRMIATTDAQTGDRRARQSLLSLAETYRDALGRRRDFRVLRSVLEQRKTRLAKINGGSTPTSSARRRRDHHRRNLRSWPTVGTPQLLAAPHPAATDHAVDEVRPDTRNGAQRAGARVPAGGEYANPGVGSAIGTIKRTVTRRWEIRKLADDEVTHVGAVLGLARLDQGDGFYVVAWEGDEPIGHAYLALTDPAELQDVAVREEHRRRGVAVALAEAAEREAAARGVRPAPSDGERRA